jgi:hypothetical protein
VTDEQKAALRDVMAPLQGWESASLDDIAEQAANAVRVCKALLLGCLPYQPPTEEEIATLARDAERIAQAFTAQSDALIGLAGVPFGEL